MGHYSVGLEFRSVLISSTPHVLPVGEDFILHLSCILLLVDQGVMVTIQSHDFEIFKTRSNLGS